MSGVLVNIRVDVGLESSGYQDGDKVVRFKLSPSEIKYRVTQDPLVKFVRSVQSAPPKEYTALVAAITDVHMALGANKLCGHCFKRELDRGYSNGCCGGCANLSDTGCVAKPVMCAAFDCSKMGVLYPEQIQEVFGRLSRKATRIRRDGGFSEFYSSGYATDAEHKWKSSELHHMRRLTQAFIALAAKVRKQHIQPDWKKVLKKLHYKPKGDLR